jgi:translation elongation factor EF-1beta
MSTKIVQMAAVYPNIDFKIYKQSIKDISLLVMFKTKEMEALQFKAKNVHQYSQNLDMHLRQNIVVLNVTTKSFDISTQLNNIRELDEALLYKHHSAEDRATLQAARVESVQSLRTDLAAQSDKLKKAADQTQSELNDMANVLINNRADEYITSIKTKFSALESQIKTKEAEETVFRADLAVLIKAQDIIREKNLADIYIDYIPSDADIDKAKLDDGKKEAIKQGVKLARKILKNVSEGLKYSELADARKNCNTNIDITRESIRKLQGDLDLQGNLHSDASAVLTIGDKRDLILSEINKLIETWQSFAAELASFDLDNLVEATMHICINAQKAYTATTETNFNKAII